MAKKKTARLAGSTPFEAFANAEGSGHPRLAGGKMPA
jgi:hypothetical protein